MQAGSQQRKENSLEQEVRDDNEKVERWLLWHEERQADYARRYELIMAGRAKPEGIPGTGYISDPTASQGIKLARLNKLRKQLELVEEVERRLAPKMQVFLRLRRKYRYRRGRNGWVAAVQHEYCAEMARLLGKQERDVWIESRNTFNGWWNRIVDYTVRLAAKRGLL